MARLIVYFELCLLVCIKTFSEDKVLPRSSSFIDDRVFWNILYYTVIYDYFYARVVLINWKSDNLAYFAALLLLCGDISQNPGPSDVFLCGVCALEVSDGDAAVCCDCCDHWVHVLCDPSLSMEDYNDMVSNPSIDPWFCFYCKESLVEHVCESSSATSAPSGISCICFNARSVVKPGARRPQAGARLVS